MFTLFIAAVPCLLILRVTHNCQYLLKNSCGQLNPGRHATDIRIAERIEGKDEEMQENFTARRTGKAAQLALGRIKAAEDNTPKALTSSPIYSLQLHLK
jgi:hypothetical protein